MPSPQLLEAMHQRFVAWLLLTLAAYAQSR